MMMPQRDATWMCAAGLTFVWGFCLGAAFGLSWPVCLILLAVFVASVAIVMLEE